MVFGLLHRENVGFESQNMVKYSIVIVLYLTNPYYIHILYYTYTQYNYIIVIVLSSIVYVRSTYSMVKVL
jgi:hypothetical protein